MDKYRFGEFIYTQRKKIGFTQDELGRKLKVTNKAVSKWETGETLPDIQLLPELASVLNVTIDELLTQVKPENEKVYIDRKKPIRYILWVISILLLLTTIVLAFVVIIQNKKETKPITLENANEYFEITPCQNFSLNGYGIIIYGSIKAKDGVYDTTLSVKFTVQYYYINTDGEISEMLYTDREVSFDPEENNFRLELNPLEEPNNFSSFYEVKISYNIVEADGMWLEQ